MFFIKPNELEAVALAAATGACKRSYLEGVVAETYASGKLTLVATDGHRLHCVGFENREPVTHQARMKIADVKRVLSSAKTFVKEYKAVAEQYLRICVQLVPVEGEDEFGLLYEVVLGQNAEEKGKVLCSFSGEQTGGGYHAGHYPDWRRIVPSRDREAAGFPQQVRGKYIADMVKAADLVTLKTKFGAAITCHKGEVADNDAMIITVEGAPDFLGLIMSMQ